ncbi:MAG: hypothetical protein LBN24_03470 [Mediterranea sp.]|jgi:hypothetical protein|nr:hypothetical protein [Mediterranea sp.]
MGHDTSLRIEDSYWTLLKGLNNEIKLRLIARLSASVANEMANDAPKEGVDKYYGAWVDDRSAEEIIADIRNSRVLGTRHIEPLDD